MKSILTIGTTFPAMYRGTRSGIVVLFTNDTTGVVVYDPIAKGKHIVGRHRDWWFSCFNTQYWERLPPDTQVILVQA